jgi:hypothetical protein
MFKMADLKIYKRIFYSCLSVSCAMILGSWLLMKTGWYVVGSNSFTNGVKDIIMFGMIGLATLYTFYANNQKKKLLAIKNIEEKLQFHRKIFKMRLMWNVFACALSCFLFLLLGRNIFLYFALYDLFMLLILFPNKTFFKKELKDEEIVFV